MPKNNLTECYFAKSEYIEAFHTQYSTAEERREKLALAQQNLKQKFAALSPQDQLAMIPPTPTLSSQPAERSLYEILTEINDSSLGLKLETESDNNNEIINLSFNPNDLDPDGNNVMLNVVVETIKPDKSDHLAYFEYWKKAYEHHLYDSRFIEDVDNAEIKFDEAFENLTSSERSEIYTTAKDLITSYESRTDENEREIKRLKSEINTSQDPTTTATLDAKLSELQAKRAEYKAAKIIQLKCEIAEKFNFPLPKSYKQAFGTYSDAINKTSESFSDENTIQESKKAALMKAFNDLSPEQKRVAHAGATLFKAKMEAKRNVHFRDDHLNNRSQFDESVLATANLIIAAYEALQKEKIAGPIVPTAIGSNKASAAENEAIKMATELMNATNISITPSKSPEIKSPQVHIQKIKTCLETNYKAKPGQSVEIKDTSGGGFTYVTKIDNKIGYSGSIEPSGDGKVQVETSHWQDDVKNGNQRAKAFADHLANELGFTYLKLNQTGANGIHPENISVIIQELKEINKDIKIEVTIGEGKVQSAEDFLKANSSPQATNDASISGNSSTISDDDELHQLAP